ncbi:hypothetical protein C8R43DRAFT_951584 [Mycena crocata]|nr:hypothetical protein C8R43DRAFT_951584 [Mycena crocata]
MGTRSSPRLINKHSYKLRGGSYVYWYQSAEPDITQPPEPRPEHSVHAGQLFIDNQNQDAVRLWIRTKENQSWQSINEGHRQTFGGKQYNLCLQAGKPRWRRIASTVPN